MIFNLVFFIVLSSVLIQGTTLRSLAKWLGVNLTDSQPSPDLRNASHDDLLEVRLDENSRVVGRQVVELGLPSTAIIVLLTRNGEAYIPQGSTVLQTEDVLLVATRRQDQADLKRLFD